MFCSVLQSLYSTGMLTKELNRALSAVRQWRCGFKHRSAQHRAAKQLVAEVIPEDGSAAGGGPHARSLTAFRAHVTRRVHALLGPVGATAAQRASMLETFRHGLERMVLALDKRSRTLNRTPRGRRLLLERQLLQGPCHCAPKRVRRSGQAGRQTRRRLTLVNVLLYI